MLGIALLHFLPDANGQLHSLDRVAEWMLGGFLMMFLLQRFFHFHHHDLAEGDPEDCDQGQPASGHHEMAMRIMPIRWPTNRPSNFPGSARRSD